MLDRINAPQLQLLDKIKIIEAQKVSLDNGLPVFSINAGTQDLVKLEFVFPAGDVYQPEGVISSATAHLMDDGTATKSAAQIAEAFDFYGASLEAESDFHEGALVLYTLNKFLEPTLDLLLELLTQASFPQAEIDNYIKRQANQLLVSNEKVDYLARKHFRAALFGNHPYGNTAEIEDYQALQQSALLQFYKSNYNLAHGTIIVSGKVSDATLALIKKKVGALKLSPTVLMQPAEEDRNIKALTPTKQFFKKENAVQSAIRIGKIMPNRKHDDYKKLTILNTVLGGYFGSRLMSNIREDKGYTYGIGSNLISNLYAGNFVLATEVGNEVRNAAIDEIYKEINLLTTEPIGDEELNLVKNYMNGAFLRSLDGPFGLAQRFRTLLSNDLTYDYYYDYLETLKATTAEDLLLLAQKYFQTDSFTEVIVG